MSDDDDVEELARKYRATRAAVERQDFAAWKSENSEASGGCFKTALWIGVIGVAVAVILAIVGATGAFGTDHFAYATAALVATVILGGLALFGAVIFWITSQ
jgi:hypothetical protein